MAENNSSAPLLPCPFCGERTQINALGRSWWRMESGHRQDCLLSEVDHTVPQTDEQKQLLIDAWNTRAPQAVAAQAAPAAPDTNLLRAEILEHASKGSRLVRTLFNEPTGTLSDVEVGDWIQRAQQYLTLPLQAAPAAVAVPEGWVPCTITYEGQYPEDVAYGPKIMMARLKKWLERYFTLKAEMHAEPVAWANWKVGSTSYAPYRTRTQAQASVSQSEIAATQEGPYEVVPLYTAPQAQPADALDAAFEAVRKRFCKLPRYSFLLDGKGNVRRVPSFTGNWVEFEAAHTLFDPQSVDAAMAAAQEGGNAAKEA